MTGRAPACAGQTERFFSNAEADIDAARAICAHCSTCVKCLFMALARRESFGVWGGMSAEERAELIALLRARTAP